MIKVANATQWIKSSYSSLPTNNCVIVRSPEPDGVQVADSKVTDGSVLNVSPDAFAAFVAGTAR
jgi:hypothetical protein